MLRSRYGPPCRRSVQVMLCCGFLLSGLSCLLLMPSALAEEPRIRGKYDVIVYSATPCGIAAALAAADDGQEVLLVEPTVRIGGLTTNGLSHADFRTFPGLTGTFREFAHRVDSYYRHTDGEASAQVEASFGGTQGEPSVNLKVLEQMLAERPTVTVLRSHVLASVELEPAEPLSAASQVVAPGQPQRIARAVFQGPQSPPFVVTAAVYIDASYEGDLMAAAGVPFHVGRESRHVYGESLAPEHADSQVQGYNFRLIMTTDPENRVMPAAPPGYEREQFLGVLPILASGQIESVFGYPSRCIIKAHTPGLPNSKYDINDVSRGLVRLSLPGENQGWPTGDAATRQRIFDAHRQWNEGLIYFLQNDSAVPETFRTDARRWGWCRDEFLENDHLPVQLYVREARRMIGSYVYTQSDTDQAPGDVRSKWHTDSIAMGDYGPNCHGTGHEGGRFDGRHTGEFYHRVAPYQIPYGVLTPDRTQPAAVTNLLVPGAVSSSHVGFCALRLEPIWTSLGQAAGHAAHLAIASKRPVQEVSVPELQTRLHQTGAATIYISDVLPTDPDFELVQWWGSCGGFHGLCQSTGSYGQRGKQIVGQYYEPFPDHAAGLEQILDTTTLERWATVALNQGFSADQLPVRNPPMTRRAWLVQLRTAR